MPRRPDPAAPSQPDEGADKLPVRAVQRAFQLLAEVGGAPDPVSLSELARRLGLPTSTVARLLATLEGTGFVQKTEGARYRPGARLVLIGLTALRGSTLYDLAEPHLQQLSQATSETANLAVRADGGHWVYLRQVLSRHAIHHASRIGRVMPLHDTSVGAALREDLGGDGYAARRGTFEPDVSAVAAPVRLPGGAVAAALSVSGPTYRISDEALHRYGLLVVRAAQDLSLHLSGARTNTHTPLET